MITKIDKRARALLFRERLAQALREKGESQSGLARAIGADRSTISQVMSGDGARLPNAQIVGECAAWLGVSSDWLLGLSERPESAADLMAINLAVTQAPRALVDEQIIDWHREASGYKIRHVPASLPDILKTNEMLEWEYRPHLGRTTLQAINAAQDRLELMRTSPSDYEFALPLHELASFARGEGYYADLPIDVRKAQIENLSDLYAQFYPRLRIHLFDARRVYSAPVTVFGPLLAVLYVGHNYIAFRDTERVQTLTQHFDALVREAALPDRDFNQHLESLSREIV